jgi:hypothetical protein
MPTIKMKADWFCRGVRMQHDFSQLIKPNDPLHSVQETEMPWPMFPKDRGSSPFEVKSHGQAGYRKEPSPVVTPSGRRVSLDGPYKDHAQEEAMPIPVGTKRRYGPLKTDK